MWNHSIEEIFRTAEGTAHGIGNFHQQMDYHGVAIEELQRLIAAYELEVFVHAYSWDLNLCALQESVRAVSILETKSIALLMRWERRMSPSTPDDCRSAGRDRSRRIYACIHERADGLCR